jgi:membrane-associated phospholipid phosphatase
VFFTLIAMHWRRPAIQVFAAFCAIAVAVSRVYLMAHWITDVMAGAVLGMSIALVVSAVSQRIQKKPLTQG